MINEQNDFFNEYYESLGHFRWMGVKDLSEMFDVSQRTIFQWLKDEKIKGVKWKNKRLIDSVSVIGFLLQKKCLEMSQIKQREIKQKIEYEGFVKKGDELFD
jgi:transposase